MESKVTAEKLMFRTIGQDVGGATYVPAQEREAFLLGMRRLLKHADTELQDLRSTMTQEEAQGACKLLDKVRSLFLPAT